MSALKATTPHFIIKKEDAVVTEHGILPISQSQYTHAIQDQATTSLDKVFLGFKMPYLPDLITSRHLTANNESDKLLEIIQKQVAFISGLGKWKGAAFSLRYILNPETKSVGVFFLISGWAPKNSGTAFAKQLVIDVVGNLTSLEFTLEGLNEIELKKALQPWPKLHIAEARQQEGLAKMIRGGAYVVYPFRPSPGATWINLFRLLSSQTSPCLLNIHLEPTHLFRHEEEAFSEAAQLAHTLSNERFEGHIKKIENRDPVAQRVGDLYNDYLKRLREPFLLTTQAASPDPFVARNIVQAFASELTENHPLDKSSAENNAQLSGFDIAIPQISSDPVFAEALSLATLTDMNLTFWGDSEANENQKRLRFLVDAKTASAAFRFPIGVRGGIPGIQTKQALPTFEVGSRTTEVDEDEIFLGEFADRGGLVSTPIDFLTRHTLIAGTTGSGKTTTSFQLLTQLWEKSIPFLVIEPTKSEYRSLINSGLKEQLTVFTLGDESLSPFRLNPFELLPGVRVEAHIAALRSCFEAALPTFGILPSLIEESLYSIYLKRGWQLTDKGSSELTRQLPTLGDFYKEIIRAVESRGYSEKTQQDIRAAAAGRIGSMLRGSKGRMLNTSNSIPFEDVMTQPCVLELDSLNDDERALMMMFLLTFIREYCKTTREKYNLQHITLIEEAHRVMSAVPHASDRESMADTKAQSVEMFSAMLSEVGSLGEGIVIAEQIPSRLTEDALKNTNTKIIHRLLGGDDHDLVGSTMNMDDEQKTFLAKLSNGQAAYFIKGYEQPTLIQVSNYRDNNDITSNLHDNRVEAHMKGFFKDTPELLLPFEGCSFCQKQCEYRDRIMPLAYGIETGKHFRGSLFEFEGQLIAGEADKGWEDFVNTIFNKMNDIGLSNDLHAAYCYLAHMYEGSFTKHLADRFFNTKNGGS